MRTLEYRGERKTMKRDKIEILIKEYLRKNLDLDRVEKTIYCFSENVLIDYLEEKLNSREYETVNNHITNCSFCLSQLILALEAQIVNERRRLKQAPREWIEKAKALLKSDNDRERKRIRKNKRVKKNLFLGGAIIFFLLSFLIPRYFIQFLVATLILGLRWALESESGHTLIMVLDSWRRHSLKKDEEISRRLKDRSNYFSN
jgi:hypothetical protein